MIKLFGKELNPEEIFVWACIQFPFYFIVGWYVLPLMVISGIFGALGGAKYSKKGYRTLGVPFATSVAVVAVNPSPWHLLAFIPAGWGVCTLGYGMPDKTDRGSVLGRFYIKLLQYKPAVMATRLTTYILYWVSFLLVSYFLK